MLFRESEQGLYMARKLQIDRGERGTIVTLEYSSKVLRDNPLDDPHERPVNVYLPAAYDHPRAKKRRFTVLFDLAGFTGTGPAHLNWKNFEENVQEKLDRLIATNRMSPTIVVFPDCFTALGGNQYINSSAIGRYADYLTRELVPFVDREFRTRASRDHRGCFGKSSGGYGAMIHAMRYPECWGAIANQSGDAYFDFVYRSEWPRALTHLQKFRVPPLKAGERRSIVQQRSPGHDDGRVRRFLDKVWENSAPSGDDVMTLMMVAMAASYDPDKNAPNGFRLPFDLETGELIARRWQAWLRHDPVELVEKYKANLKTLRGLFIDCGWRDQFHIHYGARQLSRRLRKQGVRHRYEEFDDNHSGIDYRMDVSLPYLARCLH
jgi:enterochelin esterase-like enzyme